MWTKTSDDFPDDCETLSDAAYRLHHEGLSWSNRKLLDCVLPLDSLRRFATRPEAVDELLAAGFWQVSPDGDAYVIRHHARYQRTRAQVLAQQSVNRANGSRGGRPRKGTPKEVWGTEPQSDSLGASPRETPSEGPRPGHVDDAGAAPVPAQETDSVSDSLREPKTEGDGTGRDGRSPHQREGFTRARTSASVAPAHACAGPGVCRMPGCASLGGAA